MIIFIVISVVQAFITYDSNVFTKYAYLYPGGGKCISPAQKQDTVYFSGTFERPPKIILSCETFDTEHPKINYTILITDVTTQILFRWQAIDDERIQVINEFNMMTLENKTYLYENVNAEEAFISLINLSYKGPVYFDILFKQTKTDVQVIITTPNDTLSNLTVLGYQVILGTKEAISILDSHIKTTALYTSPQYSIQANSWFITPISGFAYNAADNIRIKRVYTQDSSNIQFSIDAFQSDKQYTPSTHSVISIKYLLTIDYVALECKTIRITQIKERLANFRNSFEVELMETNEVIKDLGTTNFIIDKSLFQIINLKVYARCYPQKKIKSYFNKCNGCSPSQQHYFSHNCYGAINTINFSVKFFPKEQAYQELIIILSNVDCQIYQKLYNQEKSQVKLIEINQLDN
ncbi:unnamed protein product [Paramecium octaurelia]|uniref:H-type lectin domain-containing protein n=1 Tax=Paramecium octaurelia TaxID=43137 RepID=A0A8S1UYI0_PAROT|nr:unnamed protein product [Paramecium octaurelia]